MIPAAGPLAQEPTRRNTTVPTCGAIPPRGSPGGVQAHHRVGLSAQPLASRSTPAMRAPVRWKVRQQWAAPAELGRVRDTRRGVCDTTTGLRWCQALRVHGQPSNVQMEKLSTNLPQVPLTRQRWHPEHGQETRQHPPLR